MIWECGNLTNLMKQLTVVGEAQMSHVPHLSMCVCFCVYINLSYQLSGQATAIKTAARYLKVSKLQTFTGPLLTLVKVL